MTAVMTFPDKSQFPMAPEETERWVSSYGAELILSNGSQNQYRAIEPSQARLIVNTHAENQIAAIERGNRRYQESQPMQQ